MPKEKDLSPMSFDDDVIEIDISVLGEQYILREANGTASSKYQNKAVEGIRLGSQGKAANLPNNAGNLNAELIASCLFVVPEDSSPPIKKVVLATVYSWPHKTIEKLAKRLRDISDLDPEGDTIEALEKEIKEARKRIIELKEEESAKNDD